MTSGSITISSKWILGPKSTPFFTQTWHNPSATRAIVFIHGFNEHIVRYNTYFTLLAALSSSTIFAFDQRGFGQTGHTAPPPLAEIEGAEGLALGKLLRSKPGRTNTEQQKEDIAFWVKRESNLRGGKVWIYGHSMGGALALGTPFIEPSIVPLMAGVVSSAPLIHQTHPAPKIVVSLGSTMANLSPLFADRIIPTPLDLNKLSRDPAQVEANKADPLCPQSGSLGGVGSMLNHGKMLLADRMGAKWPVELPILIVHGSDDQITDSSASRTFHSHLPSVHSRNAYISVPDAYHELHNEPEEVMKKLADDVATFINEQSMNASAEGGVAGEKTEGEGELPSRL